MRKRKTIFCKKELFEKFIESAPTTYTDEADTWRMWYNFIKRSDVILDMTVEEFIRLAKNNTFVTTLHSENTGGNCSINFVDKINVATITAANMTSEKACAFYLTDKDDDTCRQLSNKLGLIVANQNMMKQMKYLFADNGCSYPSSHSAENWEIVGHTPTAKFTNTVLITDLYILKDNWKKKLDNNIIPILSKLLPENSHNQCQIQIAVFTKGEYLGYADDQYDHLVSAIKRIRGENFNFTLTIYYGCDNFHDRTIITNNLYITSGRGFDIFPDKSDRKPTEIGIKYPFFNEGSETEKQYNEYYLQVLTTAKHLASNIALFRKGDEGIVYRLFEHYLSTDETADERNRPIFPTTTAATATATTSTQQPAASNQQPTTSSPLRQRQRFTVVGNMDVSAWQNEGRWQKKGRFKAR